MSEKESISNTMQDMLVGKINVMTHGFKVATTNGGIVLEIKEGDRFYFDSHKNIHMLTGKSRGIVFKPPKETSDYLNMCGLECEDIALSILKDLNVKYGLNDILEANAIEKEEILQSIIESLMKYN